jgi:hypothetical protein
VAHMGSDIHVMLTNCFRFCRKVRFLGQNPKIRCQEFNGLETPKLSKKQLCDRTVRGGKRRHLFETRATKRVGECGEAAALGIGEPQSLTNPANTSFPSMGI